MDVARSGGHSKLHDILDKDTIFPTSAGFVPGPSNESIERVGSCEGGSSTNPFTEELPSQRVVGAELPASGPRFSLS